MSGLLLLPLLLLILGATSLALMGGVRADRTKKAIELRLMRVSGQTLVTRIESQSEPNDPLGRFRRPAMAVLGLVGVDLARAPDYPVPWWIIMIGAVVASRGISFLIGTVAAGLGWLVWLPLFILVARLAFGTVHARRSTLLLRQFPDALTTIVRTVRVGIPVQEALRVVAQDMPAPTGREFSRIADQVAIGTPLEQALRQMADRVKLAEYGFFATAISLQSRYGGGLVTTLEGLAEVIRKRVAMKARGYALASEARTSALVLGIIPLVAALAIEVIQPSYLRVLFVTHAGKILLAVAIGLLAGGAMVMREIIRRSLN
ncbi:type II secretion system F family protein [Acidocella sp. C78]|uniref:type II secretion system F family protein n=1 Tax=Acidocella sp. C78 TaxID=1671486 RepID=UPI00191BA922|nr:type II secretion system F family protein [Acidocella sp. C78]